MLEVLGRKKFKFAQYAVATVVDGKVYALDIKGSLIVLDRKLTKSKIYDLGEVTTPVYIAGKRLYKDGTIVALDRLNYE